MEVLFNLFYLYYLAMVSRRYYALSEYLKGIFGKKVRKIMLDAGFTCPNRDGTKGTGGCIYCNYKGSGTGLFMKGFSLEEQIRLQVDRLCTLGYDKFIAYFQSFSNTYGSIEYLDKVYSVVLKEPLICGIAVGTRPDCVNEEIVDLLKSYVFKGYLVWVELGLQSIHDTTLAFINRCHTFSDFVRAYELLRSKGIPVVVHVIFGLPNETFDMQIETIKTLAAMKVDGIKFHALYILRNTKLAELYEGGVYSPISLEDYVELVVKSLEILPPTTVIHRLTSEAKNDDLIAPLWVTEKRKVIYLIERALMEKNTYQGRLYIV